MQIVPLSVKQLVACDNLFFSDRNDREDVVVSRRRPSSNEKKRPSQYTYAIIIKKDACTDCDQGATEWLSSSTWPSRLMMAS